MKFYYENRIHLQDPNIPVSIYENKDFSYIAHWHNDVEVAIVKAGTIYVGINNERRKLAEGDMILCCSGDIHYYESTGETSTVIILVFKPEIVGHSSQWPEDRGFITSFLTKEILKNSKLMDIIRILQTILKEKKEEKPYYEMFIKSHIIEICALFLRHLKSIDLDKKSKSKYISEQKLMQNIMVYIEEKYSENITLKEIAVHFHMDFFNLSKKFNGITGMNFKAYLNALRVSKAEIMIVNTTMPLMDIAFECGFNSIRNFNRVYKALKGCTPSSVRGEKNSF